MIYRYSVKKSWDMSNFKEFASYDNQTPSCLDVSDVNYVCGTLYYNKEEDEIIKVESAYEPNSIHCCQSRVEKTTEIYRSDIQEYQNDYNFKITDQDVYNQVIA